MDTRHWLLRFQQNVGRPDPALPRHVDVPPRWRTPLIDSLARFQLGEAGEGRIAGEARTSTDPLLDHALRNCIALWVREEGRHARELGAAVRALGGETIRHHPTEALFRRARRMLGLRTKLVVAAAAEVVGLVHYELLAERVPSAALRDFFALLVAEEKMHLDFLRDVVERAMQLAPTQRVAAPVLFVTALTSATALLALDHRKLHSLLDCSPTDLALRCTREVEARVRSEPLRAARADACASHSASAAR